MKHLTATPTEKHGIPAVGFTLLYCTRKIIKKTFQTGTLKINFEPILTFAAKLEGGTNVDHILGGKHTMSQTVLGPQRIDHEEGISLGGKLLHCGRRVKTAKLWV